MNGCKKCPAFAKCIETYRGSGCAALRWTYGLEDDPEIDATNDVKKKLAFLLSTSPYLDVVDGRSYEQAADDLGANGVTVQKWISVKDRLPQEHGEACKNVNLLMDNGFVTVGWLNQVTNRGYYLDAINDVVIKAPLSRFTHWLPLPEPPGGE